MSKHYQVWFNGKLASTHLTRNGAQSEIGKLVLKGWKGMFELKEGCANG
jgi:hypothetical protein